MMSTGKACIIYGRGISGDKIDQILSFFTPTVLQKRENNSGEENQLIESS